VKRRLVFLQVINKMWDVSKCAGKTQNGAR
jgi:hypothetical protein